MSDIEKFLTSIGLASLASGFEQEGITLGVLPELTAEDAHSNLKDLGVDRMGDRLKLIKAAKTLPTAGDGSSTDGQPAKKVGSAPPQAMRHAQLTCVIFRQNPPRPRQGLLTIGQHTSLNFHLHSQVRASRGRKMSKPT